MPRERHGTFQPVIVKKGQRRLTDVDAAVLSLYARGLTTGEIGAHFAAIYGPRVSKGNLSRTPTGFIGDMQLWAGRPLQGVGSPRQLPTGHTPALHWPGAIQTVNRLVE